MFLFILRVSLLAKQLRLKDVNLLKECDKILYIGLNHIFKKTRYLLLSANVGYHEECLKSRLEAGCRQVAVLPIVLKLLTDFSFKMNPMTNVKNIKKLSEGELRRNNRTSWHDQYRNSAWLFVGGLPYDLTEGDIICVFSQFGEPVNVNLIRDKDTGKSKGFCFLCYEDQRSTDLAVDNFNGIKLLGRTIRVDHVENYKPPKSSKDEKRETSSTVTKEKEIKENISDENDSSSDKTSEKNRPLRKKKKKKRESDHDGDISCEKKRKRDSKAHKCKNSEENSAQLESEKKKTKKRRRKSSDSDSSSTSSSSSSEASSSNNSDRRNKRKIDESQRPKRNRTVEDLKREAKLIHAELKRRQRLEEREKKTGPESDEERRRKRDSKACG